MSGRERTPPPAPPPHAGEGRSSRPLPAAEERSSRPLPTEEGRSSPPLPLGGGGRGEGFEARHLERLRATQIRRERWLMLALTAPLLLFLGVLYAYPLLAILFRSVRAPTSTLANYTPTART